MTSVETTFAANPCSKALGDLSEERNRDAIFMERAIKPLVDFAEVMTTAKNAKEAAQTITKTDYRGKIFQLEDIVRLYKDEQWAEPIVALRPKIKALEDTIGAAVDAHKRPAMAKADGLREEAVAILQEEADEAMDALEHLLEKDRWIGENSPAIKDYLKRVSSLEIPSQSENSEMVQEELDHRAREISKTKFDMDLLQEGGVHKLRRDLRWFLINIQALRGQIQIVERGTVPRSLAKYMELPEESKKYLTFEQSKRTIKSPILYSKFKYYALSYFVDWFGKIKDKGEVHEFYLEALLKSGVYKTEKQANAYLIPLLVEKRGWKVSYTRDGKPTFYVAEARQAYGELTKSKVIKSFP